MTLTIIRPCIYATLAEWGVTGLAPRISQVIRPGVKVDYVAHVIGGMVRVRYMGLDVIIHPGATQELSEKL